MQSRMKINLAQVLGIVNHLKLKFSPANPTAGGSRTETIGCQSADLSRTSVTHESIGVPAFSGKQPAS